MAEKYSRDLHVDFSGGVNLAVGRLIKADNEMDYLENGELDQIGPIKKVRGYTQRGASVKAGYDILGLIGAFKPSDGTRKQIAVADGAANSDAYTYNSITSTWTPHGLSLTTGAKAEFEQFLDGFFMVNFSDATRYNNLSAWSTVTNVTGAPKARYIKLYLSRIYLAYCVDGATTYPSRVIYSDLPAGTPMTIAWNNSVNYFDVDTDDGDVIKGLEVNSNRLLIFKENALYRYDTNTLYKVPGSPGTVSQRSVKNIQGFTVYLHSSGLWGFNGTSSSLLSRRIKDIIEGISTKNLTDACAVVRGDHYYCYVGDIINSRADLNIPNCLLDYDISKNSVTWRSLATDPTVFASYRDDRSAVTYNDATLTYNDAETTYNGLISSEERVYFGDMSGDVFQFDTGLSYDGVDIAFRAETKDYYFDDPALYKLLHKLQVYVNSGKGVSVQYKVDDRDWRNLGKVDKTQTELLFPASTRGKRVKYRISESGTDEQFMVEGIETFYTLESLIE